MKIHRIYAIILRNLYFFRRSMDRITDAFWWPTIDIAIWGLTSVYIQKINSDVNSIILTIISGLVLWVIVYRGQYEINVGFLDDVWNRNVINIFASPITFLEWTVSFMFIGLIKVAISFFFSIVLAFILFKLNIFTLGFILIPFGILLLMSAWWVSFFVSGLILRFGTRVQSLAWTLLAIIFPFSAVFYPVNILPAWGQFVAHLLPTSYVFEGMRQVIYSGTFSSKDFAISLGLNLIYLTITAIFLKSSFNAILKRGLTKIY